ncbi:hypothetical protein PLESTM_001604700 [Pleodorina starrii]|nr:hypothetical protein PLESTM_001604700 [Pleodorina starrii]
MADDGGDQKFKQEGNAQGNVINLVVKDQTGNEVHFKVKMKTKLEKVFNAYCNKKGVEPSSVRFLFDGTRGMGLTFISTRHHSSAVVYMTLRCAVRAPTLLRVYITVSPGATPDELG